MHGDRLPACRAQPRRHRLGAAQDDVSGISSPNVFSYSPSTTGPSYVGVQLVYPSTSAADGEAVTLSDGVALRNWFDDG